MGAFKVTKHVYNDSISVDETIKEIYHSGDMIKFINKIGHRYKNTNQEKLTKINRQSFGDY